LRERRIRVSRSAPAERREQVRASGHRKLAEVRSLPATESTEELAGRVLGGDRWAADALYRRHAPDVYRVATLLLGRSSDVDDIVQDAFVQSFERLDTLRERASYGGWVVRIAANLARSRLRRRGLLRRLGLDRGEEDVCFEQLAVPGLSVERRAELARVGEVLRAMPADQRVAWTLRRVEGWMLSEIAKTLGASLATVKRRVAAADEYLREYVEGGRK
jgi:RNA polymerase sigma-70 factor, ECF subfamily